VGVVLYRRVSNQWQRRRPPEDACGRQERMPFSGRSALVSMMQAADFRYGYDLPRFRWLDGSPVRCVLLKTQVRSAPMIIAAESFEMTIQGER
jgi:hypothetical protein